MSVIEEWRPIPSYPDYEASGLGRIRSNRRKRSRIMTPSLTGTYLAVCLRADTSRGKRTVTVHSLVAEAFHGPRPSGLEVRHLNGDSADNRVVNLSYSTHGENLRDRARHGTDPNALKTRCAKGHPYDEANTHRTKTGSRACRACNRANVRRYHQRAAFRAAGVRRAA